MSLCKPLLLSSLLVILAACAAPTPQPPAPVLNPTVTLSPTIPPTPTATATPLPTLTPTPTAIPITIGDNLRDQREATPVAQRGAPCGVVDFFDFPLAAPEGLGAAARWPFGRYSERYSGIHAGEDWVYDFGSSLGKPVYAIGHGQVLYAAPLGWGVDKGTLIIRHTFADGRTIMSFYGHLDPPSVVLNAGDCVARGQQIAAIGQPRGRPHLHFEIRNIFPDRPGPGYWSVDPTLAGWEPPSEYIWDERMNMAPGVKWTRVFTDSDALSLGQLCHNLVAVYQLDRLAALDADTGKQVWKTERDELPSWGTPTVAMTSAGPELVTNASNYVRGYDPRNGKELWKLGRSSKITAPTPLFADDKFVIASGRAPERPIFVVKAGARGDLTLPAGQTASEAVAWSRTGRGSYMPTPLVYDGILYVLANNGLLDAYDLKTGEEIYRQRLPLVGSGFSSSPVAADGKLYLSNEDGEMLVIAAGRKYAHIATNSMGELLMATPALSEGVMYVRSAQSLFAIGRKQ